ncbi:DUF2442 domain-containing protein [Anaerolineales bacterium HSG6]|nr:DUF2442 domain-containing protein [Anaerolineales bacterium HSG6]
MSFSVNEFQLPKAQNVNVTDDTLTVDLTDGRTILVPLTWYPRLLYGTPKEQKIWELIGDGEGIHWPELDEDLSIKGIILGNQSGESQRSFKKWLDRRAKEGKTTKLSTETTILETQ